MADDDNVLTSEHQPVAAPKRSFFAKSSFTKPKLQEQEDDVDLFRQSSQVFEGIIAERERERRNQQRAAEKVRAEAKQDKRSSDDQAHQRKKRRISSENSGSVRDDDGDYKFQAKPPTTVSPHASPQRDATRNAREPAGGSTSRHRNVLDIDMTVKQSEVVEIGSESSDHEAEDDFLHKSRRGRPQTGQETSEATIIPTEEEDSDPDIRELIRKTKEQQRQREGDDRIMTWQKATAEVQRAKGPTLSIFITTQLEGAKPMIIKVTLDHKIKDIRQAFCDFYVKGKQTLTQELASQVIITWRGYKQWDYTSLRTMLKTGADITLDDEGNLRCSSDRTDGLTADLEKIHVEATTQSLFDKAKTAELTEKHRPILAEVVNASDQAQAEPSSPAKADLIKIVLKEAKEYGELKLKIRAADPFSKLENAFRLQKKIPNHKEVFLMFDGDRLGSDVQFGQTDMEPDDVIEVYVR